MSSSRPSPRRRIRDGRLSVQSARGLAAAAATIGARLNLADIQPYADVRYLDRDGDDAAIAQVSFAIGARLPF